jgi:phenazine biosynthesis protein phzE
MLPDPTQPYAMLRRECRDHVEILTGPVETVATLADIPLDTEVLVLVPYRQVQERGFDCVDDGTPLRVLRVEHRAEVPLDAVEAALPDTPVTVTGGAFDVPDEAYADVVGAVLRDEIGRGEGSNFVIHRVFEADFDGDPRTVFKRLLRQERGAYWTFIVHDGLSTIIGATPERHVSVEDGIVMMNPISGTYRHPEDRDGLLRFLNDRKEIDELSMVLDEELKMMATVADLGGQVIGPYLKEMNHLVHTEYLLAGRGSRDVRDVLRETMFAPTVVGSPIENACRVVARHERRGRGYYGGVLALIDRETLDAPILIRTAYVDAAGRLRVPVGATLVRHSTAAGEVAETHTKAAGVLAALGVRAGAGPVGDRAPGYAADAEVQAALHRRNETLAPFWLEPRDGTAYVEPSLKGRTALVVDAEDTFTGMLTHQLRVLGLSVTLRSYQEIGDVGGFDLIVPGPGPGDPRSASDPKMAVLRSLVARLLAEGRPTLAVCLSHQILAGVLGLPLRRKHSPYQGMQRVIDFFGRPATGGFYSTFTATAGSDWLDTIYGPIRVARDPENGDVHALRGPAFASLQFHAESVLSEHGIALLRDLLLTLNVTTSPK